VDRFDADGTRVSGQESTNPPIPCALKKNLRWGAPLIPIAPLEWRGPVNMIMRATLHQRAANTYYGHWQALRAL
jgi:hypothetical protein